MSSGKLPAGTKKSILELHIKAANVKGKEDLISKQTSELSIVEADMTSQSILLEKLYQTRLEPIG